MMYCKYCGSEKVFYVGIDDGGGDYGDRLVSIFHCDDCNMDIEGNDVESNLGFFDEGYDCIMCGKPINKHSGKRCAECEQVWNS